MPKVSVIVVIYEARQYIQPVFSSIFRQTQPDLEVVAVINGTKDGSKEMIAQSFPGVRIIDPGENLWFAKGNNLGIAQTTGEFVLLVNQDIVMAETYVAELLGAFAADSRVGATTGKLLRYDFTNNRKLNIIDTTGITMSDSGRGKDRGQLEEDRGQYDAPEVVFGVSGACPMYRRTALERVKFENEYFDEDFVAYWEDVDLSWRLNSAGFKNVYVPTAVGWHGRTAGQAEGGYLKVLNFIRHHRKLPQAILRHNYKNHIFLYLKNSPRLHAKFFLREIAMFCYVLVFETSTLAVIPEMFRLFPRMRRKRAQIFNAKLPWT